MSIYQLCAWCPERPEEDIESPRSRVTDGVSHDGWWEPTLSPVEEQLVFLTAEPSPAPRKSFLNICHFYLWKYKSSCSVVAPACHFSLGRLWPEDVTHLRSCLKTSKNKIRSWRDALADVLSSLPSTHFRCFMAPVQGIWHPLLTSVGIWHTCVGRQTLIHKNKSKSSKQIVPIKAYKWMYTAVFTMAKKWLPPFGWLC